MYFATMSIYPSKLFPLGDLINNFTNTNVIDNKSLFVRNDRDTIIIMYKALESFTFNVSAEVRAGNLP